VALGGIGLVIGARLTVDGALGLARELGVSEAIIGLTIVAVGTSLPELAASVIAALRRQADLAVGNVVGSNIFNLLLVLGVAGVLVDQSVEARIPGWDMPIMVGLAILPLVIALVAKRTIPRWAGIGLLAIYATWLALDPVLAV